MDPILINAVVAAIGAALPILATRFGWKVPYLVPPPAPSADKEATDFFDWIVRVDTGATQLDTYDRAVLTSTKPVFDRVVGKMSSLPPAPVQVPQSPPQFPVPNP